MSDDDHSRDKGVADWTSRRVSPAYAALAAQLRAERERQGLTQRALARRIEDYSTALCNWERGRSVPGIAPLAKWAAGLGLELKLSPIGAKTDDADLREQLATANALSVADHLATEAAEEENDRLRAELAAANERAETAEARLAKIGELREEWTVGDAHGPHQETNDVKREEDVRYWMSELESTTRGWRRLVGEWREVADADAEQLRTDVPDTDPAAGFEATQLYNPASIYAITPCTEDTARRAAGIGRIAPVQQWELPASKPRDHVDAVDDGPYDYGDDDDERPY